MPRKRLALALLAVAAVGFSSACAGCATTGGAAANQLWLEHRAERVLVDGRLVDLTTYRVVREVPHSPTARVFHAADVAFVADGARGVRAVDLATGDDRWTAEVAGPCYGAFPLAGRVIAWCAGELAVLDPASGRTLARQAMDAATFYFPHALETALLVDPASGPVRVLSVDGLTEVARIDFDGEEHRPTVMSTGDGFALLWTRGDVFVIERRNRSGELVSSHEVPRETAAVPRSARLDRASWTMLGTYESHFVVGERTGPAVADPAGQVREPTLAYTVVAPVDASEPALHLPLYADTAVFGPDGRLAGMLAYAGDVADQLRFVDIAEGEVTWTLDVGRPWESGRAIAADDRVLLVRFDAGGASDALRCVERATGRERWSVSPPRGEGLSDDDPAHPRSPQTIRLHGDDLLWRGTSGGVRFFRVIDRETGAVRYAHDIPPEERR